MKRISILVLLIVCALLVFGGCKNAANDPAPEGTQTVYVAGYFIEDLTSEEMNPTLWKDNVVLFTKTVKNRTMFAAVAVVGADVYVCGTIDTDQGDYTPTLWKNITEIPLDTTGTTMYAQALAVNAGTVYVVGNKMQQNDNSVYSGMLWTVDGNNAVTPFEFQQLTNEVTNVSVTSITLIGSDIYVAGSRTNNGNVEATLWKINGQTVTPITLDTIVSRYDVAGVVAAGSDLYVAGVKNGAATQWKITGTTVTATALPNGTSVFGITVAGSDVYVCGYAEAGETMTGKVWKNAAEYLSIPNVGFQDISVAGNKVFTVGAEISGDSMVFKVWKESAVLYTAAQANDRFTKILAIQN